MHDLSCFTDRSFDIVYSSHTIEHAYHPRRVVKELTRVLRSDGELIVVLPYPDTGTENDPRMVPSTNSAPTWRMAE